MGYYDCITPPVILRNILENPGWYTQYTPYQAEIAQGRLEALLNFQTMVIDLTGLPIANASLLDEATAAAEAMHLAYEFDGERRARTTFFVADALPPADDRGRADARRAARHRRSSSATTRRVDLAKRDAFGALVQYPATDGAVVDYARVRRAGPRRRRARRRRDRPARARRCSRRPASSAPTSRSAATQRFGVPIGFGGPHAAFFATQERVRAPDARAASSASPRTRTASRRSASRCRRASSTSAARRRRATSAPRRCCSR